MALFKVINKKESISYIVYSVRVEEGKDVGINDGLFPTMITYFLIYNYKNGIWEWAPSRYFKPWEEQRGDMMV